MNCNILYVRKESENTSIHVRNDGNVAVTTEESKHFYFYEKTYFEGSDDEMWRELLVNNLPALFHGHNLAIVLNGASSAGKTYQFLKGISYALERCKELERSVRDENANVSTCFRLFQIYQNEMDDILKHNAVVSTIADLEKLSIDTTVDAISLKLLSRTKSSNTGLNVLSTRSTVIFRLEVSVSGYDVDFPAFMEIIDLPGIEDLSTYNLPEEIRFQSTCILELYKKLERTLKSAHGSSSDNMVLFMKDKFIDKKVSLINLHVLKNVLEIETENKQALEFCALMHDLKINPKRMTKVKFYPKPTLPFLTKKLQELENQRMVIERKIKDLEEELRSVNILYDIGKKKIVKPAEDNVEMEDIEE